MTNQYLWTLTRRDPDLRAADADRDRIADRLRRSHAEGRLDLTEFQQRLERCFEAKTVGELGELVRDLPREDEHDGRTGPGWFLARLRRSSLVALLVIVLIVAVASSAHHSFWLWIPLVFLIWRLSWWRRRWAGPHHSSDGWT